MVLNISKRRRGRQSSVKSTKRNKVNNQGANMAALQAAPLWDTPAVGALFCIIQSRRLHPKPKVAVLQGQ